MIKEIYAKKIGMTQNFDAEGNLSAVTLLEVEPVCLLQEVDYPTKKRVRIGCFKLTEKKAAKLKKPLAGYFKKLGVGAYKLVREVAPGPAIEVAVPDSAGEKAEASQDQAKETAEVKKKTEAKPEPNPEIGVDLFKEGDVVDVQAKTKGKGFAGGMRRHHWSGQPRTHGSTTHRRVGSVGASAYPSRVIKGLHMPGHMGNNLRTTKNLKVVKVDKDKNVLFVSGCVPGARGAVVRLRKVK